MGPRALSRRSWLAATAGSACLVAACGRGPGGDVAGTAARRAAERAAELAAAPWPARWVGARQDRGHRLREPAPAWPAPTRRARVLVLGAGVAGLAAARAFLRRGIDDLRVLELEDEAGGNARGHLLGGLRCPLGAHYLPLPGPQAHEVGEWLHEIGLLRSEVGRTVADERHLCHSPQERLFHEGAWIEGLLPPAEPGSTRLAQYRRFADRVAAAQRIGAGAGGQTTHAPAFALPAHRAARHAELDALDAMTFSQWLAREGLDDPALRGYLDYCCRDDYGAGAAAVSAWAGLHYFASRHGFAAPGDAERERDAVFTWPEGNGWLTARLAQPLGERLQRGHTVLAVREERHGVQVLAFDEAAGALQAWQAETVVLALPLFVARRLLQTPVPALAEAAAALRYAPWLVANLLLDRPLHDRAGAAPAWDNVIFGSRGLGYVDARHQSLDPRPGPTVLTLYHALEVGERAALQAEPARAWAERAITELLGAHPDLPQRLQRAELMRWGHAMAIPVPGLRRHAALQALRARRGRVRFAHADLAGYSVFEEAFIVGCEVASEPGPARRSG